LRDVTQGELGFHEVTYTDGIGMKYLSKNWSIEITALEKSKCLYKT